MSEDSEGEQAPKPISRRTFFKGLGLGAAGTIAYILGQRVGSITETAQPLSTPAQPQETPAPDVPAVTHIASRDTERPRKPPYISDSDDRALQSQMRQEQVRQDVASAEDKLHRNRAEVVDKLKKDIAVPLAQIDTRIKNAYPGILPDFKGVDAIVEAQKEGDPLQRVLKVIPQLGVETKEQVEGKKPLSYEELSDEGKERVSQIAILSEEINKISDKLFGASVSLSDTDKQALEAQYNKLWTERNVLDNKVYLERVSSIINIRYSFPLVFTCNIYSTDLCSALGLGDVISHRVDTKGEPVAKGGRELRAYEMKKWLITKGVEQYDWKDVTNEDYASKQKLLGEGYIFYGASESHTWVVVGVKDGDEVIPALTQSTDNIMLSYLPPNHWKINNSDTFVKIFAHKLPNT
jgi:hypothetical protein